MNGKFFWIFVMLNNLESKIDPQQQNDSEKMFESKMINLGSIKRML